MRGEAADAVAGRTMPMFGFDIFPLFNRETDDEAAADADADETNSEEDEDGEKPLTRSQIVRRAVTFLMVGTAACAFFSDPMVDAVTNFSRVRHAAW